MRQLEWRFFHVGLFTTALMVHQKLSKSSEALDYLRKHGEEIAQSSRTALDDSYFSHGQNLAEALQRIHSPAVLLLNKYALNITLNFLCNLQQFPGVQERLLVFAFDEHSYQVLNQSFPEVAVLRWQIMSLQDRFSAGDGRYQLFQYFRARLAAYLATKVQDFWMIQADTLWRKNLFKEIDAKSFEKTGKNILFDAEGESGLLSTMIAGGYFYVESDPRSRSFFEAASHFLMNNFATDNNVMTSLCIREAHDNHCGKLPYSLIANWRYQPSDDPTAEPPPFFQYDGGESSEQKFQKMREIGALFVDPSTLSDEIQPAKCLSQPPSANTNRPISRGREKANFVIRSAHAIFETLSKMFPFLDLIILGYVFPFYAYYLVI
ncbi:GRD-7 protein [Aphelenchoides avenae]|nr:GRD-7 protein [Aphelenchus avenae]